MPVYKPLSSSPTATPSYTRYESSHSSPTQQANQHRFPAPSPTGLARRTHATSPAQHNNHCNQQFPCPQSYRIGEEDTRHLPSPTQQPLQSAQFPCPQSYRIGEEGIMLHHPSQIQPAVQSAVSRIGEEDIMCHVAAHRQRERGGNRQQDL